MRAVRATKSVDDLAGEWRVFAHAPGLAPVDVTYVRGIPTEIGDWEWEDPFGPASCSVRFPAVTYFDRLGAGDLDWLVPELNVDVVFVGDLPAGYPRDSFRIEAFGGSFDYSDDGSLTVPLVGALHQLDRGLAKPEYPARPFPYEVAIARQWHGKPDLRISPLRIEWPSWWEKRYAPTTQKASYLIPIGVKKGDRWTGMLTRETGSWDPVLTSYVQTLLTSMYTDRGRWTIDLDPDRIPVLRHRDFAYEDNDLTLTVDLLSPGVKFTPNVDHSQSANVIFGQVTALSGEAYSGMQVSADGERTTYRPLAAMRQVHPVEDDNTWLDPGRMRKETLLQLQQGLTAKDARSVANSHLMAFADPGVTGTLVLDSDPIFAGEVIPRACVKAGMNVRLKRLFGNPEGLLVHITKVSYSPSTGTLTATVDSKFRDRLTVDEVKLRGRDALSVSRGLIGGNYAPPIPDQLLPWNYAEGSGYIPSGPVYTSLPLFRDMPDDIAFPWNEWTVQRPPSDPAWRKCYIRVPAASANADNNWAYTHNREGVPAGIPIKLAQAGSIRMIQLAAYDADGNVMAVPFHFSLYYSRGVTVQAMPQIPAELAPINGYLAGQHYPFFETAWETYKVDGTKQSTDITVIGPGALLIRAYGTGIVKAGHWPGASIDGDPATGLLVDEGVFEFNTAQEEQGGPIDPFTGSLGHDAGYVYAMVYCDAQGAEEVFFAGRMFRVEPGTST